MLTAADLTALNTACRHLYRPGLSLETYAARAYAFLDTLVPSEFVAFGSLDVAAGKLDIGFSETPPGFGAAMEAFGRIMANYDLFCWDPAVNDGRPFCRNDFFSERQFRDLDVFSEVYAPLGIDNHCAVYVPTSLGEIAFFGIERKGGRDFSAEDRQRLEIAQGHLGSARELARERSNLPEHTASPPHLERAGLTAREAEVLAWLAEGKSNEEIAVLLGLRLSTVKGYLKTVFQKIAAPNRLAAALWALRTTRTAREREALEASGFVRVNATGGRRPASPPKGG
jgi:DNA-binding CsgD family transcriptional regulator